MRETLNQGLAGQLAQLWTDGCAEYGFFPTVRWFVKAGWQFLRESTPSRKQQKYGDADFDWDYRVNTTSAGVDWRTRLLGCLTSEYQPTEPGLFREMMESLKIDFREFTFIDIGSGKGRVLLMAADYPFRRIIGVELLAKLHAIALDNLKRYRSESQRCFAVEAVCADAAGYEFPREPVVVYLFNPLPQAGLAQVIENLSKSMREGSRRVYIVYHNPLLARVIKRCAEFKETKATHQWVIYTNV